MPPRRVQLLATLVLLASFVVVYHQVIVGLVRDWAEDGNYSHGFLVVPIALYFVWERRHRLAAAVCRPTNLGLLFVVGSLLLFATGVLAAERFLTRISMLGTLAGLILYIGGWKQLRVLAFPVAFLLLMIPLPTIIFNEIAFPLQLLASRCGEATIAAFGVPVLREGNIIVMANTRLEIVEACSGIRSLISLVTLGIVYGYFMDPRQGVRVTIALLAIPVAIATNALRVAGTGIAAHYYGPEVADGFFHTFSGLLVFIVALSLLFALQFLLTWLLPHPQAPRHDPVTASAT